MISMQSQPALPRYSIDRLTPIEPELVILAYLAINGHGSANRDTAKFPDVSAREFVVLAVFVLLSIALGVVPWVITTWTEPSVYGWVQSLAVL